jgi:hypothetical protein
MQGGIPCIFVFQIFIAALEVKVTTTDQMNTNLNMLPVLAGVVHILLPRNWRRNAQKCSKMLPH